MRATENKSLTGRSALVTGGGSGIGAALTEALVAAGAHVWSSDIDLGAAEKVVAGVSGPGHAVAVPLDVTDAAAVQAVVDGIVTDHGSIDLIFNNAGIALVKEVKDQTLAEWNRIIDINIRGVVHGVQAAYPHMIEAGSGHIVNVASAAGLLPSGFVAAYCATKHAVVGLSLSLRSEAHGYGVGVTVVCPSAVETPILDTDERSRDFFLSAEGLKRGYSPQRLVEEILAAVADDKAMVVAPAKTRLGWRMNRIAPGVLQRMTLRYVEKTRAARG